MKKYIAAAVIAGLISGVAFADTNTVASANVLGYNRVTIPSNQYVLVSLAFDRGTNNTLTSLFGTLPNGSKAYVWDTTKQGYTTYARGVTGWGTSGTNRIPIGSGVFLTLPVNVQTNIYLSGDVPTAQTTTLYRVNGYTMLSFPYPVAVAITNTALAKGAVNGNKIYVWNNGYTTYARGVTGWGTAGSNVLKIGQAFYFQGAVNTNVNEIKPYTIN